MIWEFLLKTARQATSCDTGILLGIRPLQPVSGIKGQEGRKPANYNINWI